MATARTSWTAAATATRSRSTATRRPASIRGCRGRRVAQVDRTNLDPAQLYIGTIERVIVNGIGGNDAFTVSDLAGVPSLTTLNLNGFDGDDSFAFVSTSAGVVASNVHGGPGPDRLQGPASASHLERHGRESGQHRRSGGVVPLHRSARRRERERYLQRQSLHGRYGDDRRAAPASTRSTTTRSREPFSGDTTPPDGNIDSPGVQSFLFAQIETVNIVNPQPTIAIGNVTVVEGSGPPRQRRLQRQPDQSVAADGHRRFRHRQRQRHGPGRLHLAKRNVDLRAGRDGQDDHGANHRRIVPEPTETFVVNLANAANATIANAQGLAGISDDDISTISIGNVTIREGRTGSTNAVFTVTLTPRISDTVTVNFATANGTAVAPGDYSTVSGTLTFAPGQTSQTIAVPVIGDQVPEPTETFIVNLSSSSANAHHRRYQALGTIVNDDSVANDVDGDGKADLVVFRPSSGTWYSLLSSTGFTEASTTAFGVSGDIPVPGDYDGDGRSDLAVYHPANGTWRILPSSTGTHITSTVGPSPRICRCPATTTATARRISRSIVPRPASGTSFASSDVVALTVGLGLGTDIPVPADYDGDGTTDVAVYRPSTGLWSMRKSGRSGDRRACRCGGAWPATCRCRPTTMATASPMSPCIRPSTGMWFIFCNRRRTSRPRTTVGWGAAATSRCLPITMATASPTWRSSGPARGTWYLLKSSTNFTTADAIQWGLTGDIPPPGAAIRRAIAAAAGQATRSALANLSRESDFDGDARADITVWRPVQRHLVHPAVEHRLQDVRRRSSGD